MRIWTRTLGRKWCDFGNSSGKCLWNNSGRIASYWCWKLPGPCDRTVIPSLSAFRSWIQRSLRWPQLTIRQVFSRILQVFTTLSIFSQNASCCHQKLHELVSVVWFSTLFLQKEYSEAGPRWSKNKKLIEVRRGDVYRAVPRGFPYLSAAFDVHHDTCFVHVIDDDKMYSDFFNRVSSVLFFSRCGWCGRSVGVLNYLGFVKNRSEIYKFEELLPSSVANSSYNLANKHIL